MGKKTVLGKKEAVVDRVFSDAEWRCNERLHEAMVRMGYCTGEGLCYPLLLCRKCLRYKPNVVEEEFDIF